MAGEDRYANRENYVDGDPKPVGAFIGQELLATNSNAWEWTGTIWIQTGALGLNLTRDYYSAVGDNLVEGASPVTIFGHNPAVSTTRATIWHEADTEVVQRTSAATMTVSSDSTNDTSAGTGVRTVEITGLDANYNEVSPKEIVTMNGTTAVSTVNQYIAINFIQGLTAGSKRSWMAISCS